MGASEAPCRRGNRTGRIAAAALASLLSLGSAYGLAREIRGRAMHASHQQPTPEDWLEAPTKTPPALVAQGRTAFLGSCAHCHGADASGDEGPDLHGLEGSDRYILNTILRGVKGEMPSFKKKLRPEDIVKLTAYIRSLE